MGSDPVQYSLEEVMTIIEDLMRVADDLLRGGDEVNAFLVDQVVNQLGGRFIWQIEGASEHVVCWRTTDEDPRAAEIDLLTRFRSLHGRLPFANISS